MSTTTPVSAVPLRLLTTLKRFANALPMSVAGHQGWSPPFAPVSQCLVHKSVHTTDRPTGRPGDQSRDPEVRLSPNGPDLGNLERAYVIAPNTYSM